MQATYENGILVSKNGGASTYSIAVLVGSVIGAALGAFLLGVLIMYLVLTNHRRRRELVSDRAIPLLSPAAWTGTTSTNATSYIEA